MVRLISTKYFLFLNPLWCRCWSGNQWNDRWGCRLLLWMCWSCFLSWGSIFMLQTGPPIPLCLHFLCSILAINGMEMRNILQAYKLVIIFFSKQKHLAKYCNNNNIFFKLINLSSSYFIESLKLCAVIKINYCYHCNNSYGNSMI